MNRRSTSLVSFAAAFLAAASACARGGADSADRGALPPRVGDTVPTVRARSDGGEVPWLAGVRLDGDTVTMADLRGSPVLLNLWATWCPPCRAETPYLQSIHERYGGELRTVGITVDNRGAGEQVRDFLDEAGVTYEILHDPAMTSMELFDVPGLPGTFLVDARGVVRFARIGPVREGDEAFEKALGELLGPAPSAETEPAESDDGGAGGERADAAGEGRP